MSITLRLTESKESSPVAPLGVPSESQEVLVLSTSESDEVVILFDPSGPGGPGEILVVVVACLVVVIFAVVSAESQEVAASSLYFDVVVVVKDVFRVRVRVESFGVGLFKEGEGRLDEKDGNDRDDHHVGESETIQFLKHQNDNEWFQT